MPPDLSSTWEQLNAEHLDGIVQKQTVPQTSLQETRKLSETVQTVHLGVPNTPFIIQALPDSRHFHAHQ